MCHFPDTSSLHYFKSAVDQDCDVVDVRMPSKHYRDLRIIAFKDWSCAVV